jgi:signal transduction histidine kinase
MAQDMRAMTPDEQQAYLAIVAREAERLGSLVDDLMALARADADELKLTLEAVDAPGVMAEAQSALAPIAKSERQVTLVTHNAPDLPPVWADRARLAQVVLNLARNAILYTPAGGIVSLEVARADQAHLAISVADTGIGIPPDELDHIFERFYRTDASRARASGGFGLGLAIVRDLVQAMGGTVSVTSRVNEGSRFVVTLRIAG